LSASSFRATVEAQASPGGTARDDIGIGKGATAGAVLAGATDWIRHSSCEEGFDDLSLQCPDGVQQVFAPIEGNMKYCEQERQPPHSKVAVSTIAIPKLAILLSTILLSGYGIDGAYFAFRAISSCMAAISPASFASLLMSLVRLRQCVPRVCPFGIGCPAGFLS
jgi:hypothetical protein